MKRTRADLFWAKVNKAGECWNWTACVTELGYGKFGAGTRGWVRAHRFSWELHNGPIPAGMSVLHRCDNPACVRPDHLFLGSIAENSRDMVAKGRSSRGAAHGELSRRVRWTPESRRRQGEAVRACWGNPEYRERVTKAVGERSRRWWADMTPERRAEIGKKISAAKQRRSA